MRKRMVLSASKKRKNTNPCVNAIETITASTKTQKVEMNIIAVELHNAIGQRVVKQNPKQQSKRGNFTQE